MRAALLPSVILFGLLFAAVLPSSATAVQEAFTIVEPPANAQVRSRLVTVVVKRTDPGIDSILISTSAKKNKSISVSSKGKDFFCKTILVNSGINDITVYALKSGNTVASKTLKIYCSTDISRDFSGKTPSEYRISPFHTAGREGACGGCHILKVNAKDNKPDSPSNSMCYPCHRRITEFKNVHGPAARWECLFCHSRASEQSKYGVDKPEKELCFTCHQSDMARWNSKKYMHGPTATGKCSICHNPHASHNPYWLKKRAVELCVACHTDTLNPIGAFEANNPQILSRQ